MVNIPFYKNGIQPANRPDSVLQPRELLTNRAENERRQKRLNDRRRGSDRRKRNLQRAIDEQRSGEDRRRHRIDCCV